MTQGRRGRAFILTTTHTPMAKVGPNLQTVAAVVNDRNAARVAVNPAIHVGPSVTAFAAAANSAAVNSEAVPRELARACQSAVPAQMKTESRLRGPIAKPATSIPTEQTTTPRTSVPERGIQVSPNSKGAQTVASPRSEYVDENGQIILKLRKICVADKSFRNAYEAVFPRRSPSDVGRARSFNFGPSGVYTKSEAKHAAEQQCRWWSDEFGQTKVLVFPPCSEELKGWFAGFADGEGCLGTSAHHLVSVCIPQTSTNDFPPPSLELFKRYFGGTLLPVKARENRPGMKPEYVWNVKGNEARRLLEIIATHGIQKAPQAQLILDEIKDLPRDLFLLRVPTERRNVAAKALCKLRREYHLIKPDPARITPAWLAGMLDADGCITHGVVSIIQKGRTLLDAIENEIGLGSVRLKSDGVGDIQITGAAMEMFLIAVHPFLVEKCAQSSLLLERRDRLRTNRSLARSPSEVIAFRTQMKSLKRYHPSSSGASVRSQTAVNHVASSSVAATVSPPATGTKRAHSSRQTDSAPPKRSRTQPLS
jgi:hypothetical protein